MIFVVCSEHCVKKRCFWLCLLLAPVEESPTIYSVFLQENQKEGNSEKQQASLVFTSSATASVSASSLVYGANKKNTQFNKKALEKKKEKQSSTLEDALQQVLLF